MQLAKTIYFSDYPRAPKGRSGLTVPFPVGFEGAYASLAHLSSFSIRQIIGYESFSQLERDAERSQLPTATFARDLLVRHVGRRSANNGADYRVQLQSTFRGGKGSPLHDWYPYLEGYSPDFVNSIIDRFAADAVTILDPFCGSGTTALIAALRGRRGLFAEVNPVCRFVIEAKLSAVRLPRPRRERLALWLEDLQSSIESELAKCKPDPALALSFAKSFGNSEFFDAASFERVRRLRTMADELTAKDRHLGQLFTVAVLRSLVPGSLLIRRGDLRFKTPEELGRTRPQLMEELRSSLLRIASDLHDAPVAEGSAELVCNDARTLAQHLRQPVDAIITSPPYLNGTNYFRNTKIELWFMRELVAKAGLRILRDVAITAGINDVTMRKAAVGRSATVTPRLAKALKAFSGNAYDSRIPLMVQAYFAEMGNVIENFQTVLRSGGVAAIDLGDSCYGSVWVPTHLILGELMERAGFRQIDQIVLRERQSRDGRKLSQSLQVFQRAPRTGQITNGHAVRRPSLKMWDAFKQNLPHQKGDMARRNWGHSLHSLCSYQGKLKPSIAHSLVASLLPTEGGRILDPFAGVGTIPFAAQLLGHTAFGFDISPAALPITRAKIEEVEPEKVFSLLAKLGKLFKSAKSHAIDLAPLRKVRFNGPLPDYFHPQTLAEIAAAREYFRKNPPDDGSSALVFSAMLHILHGNRPYALSRRSHPITPFAPTGPTEYRPAFERLCAKVEKSLVAIADDQCRRGKAFFQDATKTWPEAVRDLDAVITSPPFFDSTRFHTANWMRLWFAGWESADFRAQPAAFVDERQKVSFDVYRTIFEQCAERLKPSGLVLIHLGKSTKCDMGECLSKVAADYLEEIDLFTESVAHCESHGIRDKGTVTHHQYLLLQRA
jgi:DNA modification methylase